MKTVNEVGTSKRFTEFKKQYEREALLSRIKSQKLQLEVQELNKKYNTKLVFSSVLFLAISFCLFLLFFVYEPKHTIKGFISVNGSSIERFGINFLNKESYEVKSILSGVDGSFHIRLKKGFYRIYLDLPSGRYSRPETSPFAIKLNRDLNNIRINIPQTKN